MNCPSCGDELIQGIAVGTGQMHFLPADNSEEAPVRDGDESLAWKCPSCGLILLDRKSPVPENEAIRDGKRSRKWMFWIGWAVLALSLLLVAPRLFLIAVEIVLQPFVCVAVLAVIGIPTYLVTRGMTNGSDSCQEE
jgi:predicted RNA-binding Zn-ribbon protein involved in translation (DUF1610 family)